MNPFNSPSIATCKRRLSFSDSDEIVLPSSKKQRLDGTLRSTKPLTTPVGFNLRTDRRSHQKSTLPAGPLPKPQVVKKEKPLTRTIPKEFKLHSSSMTRSVPIKSTEELLMEQIKNAPKFKAKPMPVFSSTFKPKGSKRPLTEPVPFSLSSNTPRPSLAASKPVAAVCKQEKIDETTSVYIVKANPEVVVAVNAPAVKQVEENKNTISSTNNNNNSITNNSAVIKKGSLSKGKASHNIKAKAPTIPKPFNLHSDKRRQAKVLADENVTENNNNNNNSKTTTVGFKARPLPSFKKVFVPKTSKNRAALNEIQKNSSTEPIGSLVINNSELKAEKRVETRVEHEEPQIPMTVEVEQHKVPHCPTVSIQEKAVQQPQKQQMTAKPARKRIADGAKKTSAKPSFQKRKSSSLMIQKASKLVVPKSPKLHPNRLTLKKVSAATNK